MSFGSHHVSLFSPVSLKAALSVRLKKVSVFCCGVQKGGTTSLHAYFSEHSKLSSPNQKELHFFDDETIDWSAPDYDEIGKYFNSDDAGKLRYDITPIYSFWPNAVHRISKYNSRAKLIFLFRDPFERAWSQWCMEWARGGETLVFADAIRTNRVRLKGVPLTAPEHRVYNYIERGLYSHQVRRALEAFPRRQILFLRSEDLRDRHVTTLAQIADFLEIADFPKTGPKSEHARPKISFPCKPTEKDLRFVASIVKADLRRFAKMTGLEVSSWPCWQAVFQ